MARPSYRALRGASDKMSSSLEQAEIILAAKELVDEFNKMAKNMAQNQADSFAIVDAMREVFGPDVAERFENVLDQAIKNTITVLKNSKDAISREIGVMNGDEPTNDMMSDTPTEPDENPDAEDTISDVFDGDEAASGPEEEPLGRAKKESIEMAKKPLKEAAELRQIGTVALVESSLNDLVNWYLTEACHGMPEDKLSVINKKVNDLRTSDPLRLAGIIADKKNALNAQLSAPVMAVRKPEKMAAVAEGKSYKRDPEDGDMDVEGKRKSSKFIRRSRKDDDLDEGRSYRRNPEDDEWDVEDKKKSSKFTRRARKDDGLEESISEDLEENLNQLCDSIKETIEQNVRTLGKGLAHQVVEAHLASFNGNKLNESKGEVTLEKVIKSFEKRFNVSPALHSIRESRNVKSKVKEDVLTPADKDKKTTTGAIASQIVKDKSAGNKTVASAAASLQGQDRVAANKTIAAMKAKGQNPNSIKAKDFVDLTDQDSDEK